MASLERARIGRFTWNALRYGIGPLGGLIVPWIVISHSSVELWGEVVMLLILVQVAAHIIQWGSKDILLRAYAREPDRVGVLTTSSAATRSLLFGVCIAIIGLLGFGPMQLHVHLVGPWLLAVVAYGSVEAWIIWTKRFARTFLSDLGGMVAQVTMLLFLRPLTAELVIGSFLLGTAVRFGLLAATNAGDMPLSNEGRMDFKRHIVQALPFFLTGFSGLLASRIDLYSANALLDRGDVGRYQVVTSVFLQFQALAALITTPMTRDLYRLRAGGVARFAVRLRTGALIGLLSMAVIAWTLLTFFFHFELDWTIIAAGCLLVWPVFAYVPLITPLYKQGHERTVMHANFAAAALNGILTWTLMPHVGIAGGMLAAAAGQWLMLLWVRRQFQRMHHAMPTM